MNRQVVLRPAAKADLRAIWTSTVDRWSHQQAEAYTRGISGILGLLAQEPEIAREHREIVPAVRMHPFRSHLIIFRATSDRLEVIRVLHARSNWRAILLT